MSPLNLDPEDSPRSSAEWPPLCDVCDDEVPLMWADAVIQLSTSWPGLPRISQIGMRIANDVYT